MKRANFGLLVLLAGCSKGVPLGETRAEGILSDAPLARFAHAVFDVFEHDQLRHTYYVVVSPDEDICGKLQRKELLDDALIVMSQNSGDSQHNSASGCDYEKTRNTLLSASPNWAGGLLHLTAIEDGGVRIVGTSGHMMSHVITEDSFEGHAVTRNNDSGEMEFHAKRCRGASDQIRALLTRAKYDESFDRTYPNGN